MNAIHILLQESIDYAGLFPPAELDMTTAVENCAGYRRGASSWALGRFIVPVRRLPELEAAASRHVSRDSSPQPWRLGVLAGPDLEADLEQLELFNHRSTGTAAGMVADALEVKATSVRGIEDIMRRIPGDLQAYIEIPVDREPRELIEAIGRLGGRAKVRTGGVTGDAFPITADLIRFLRECVRARVAFKATAGLHHPLRAEYRLTYAPGSASGTMFGFLNLFLAAAFLQAGMEDTDAAAVLEERSREAFQVGERGIGWRNHWLDAEALRASRQKGVVSFGSCSFTEPIGDLEALHLLEPSVQRA